MERISVGITLVCLTVGQLFFASSTFSQDNEERSEFDCKTNSATQSIHFETIELTANAIDSRFCVLLRSSVPASASDLKEASALLPDFGALVSQKIKHTFDPKAWPKLAEQANYFEESMIATASGANRMPALQVSVGGSIGVVRRSYFFGRNQQDAALVTNENNSSCTSPSGTRVDCDELLDDLGQAIRPYQQSVNAFTAQRTFAQLEGLSEEWDQFMEEGRYQNTAGIALTTIMEREHLTQDHHVGPPPRQWHALQPTLVIENAEEAPDGDNLEYGIALEWIGVNWWKDSLIGVPFGVSLASVYTDRAEVADLGHGLMFHFDNKYTIGLADHDGDTGVYITLDLLTLMRDKQAQLDKYRERTRLNRD